MYSCHSILECCVTFSGVKLSIRSFVLFMGTISRVVYIWKKVRNLSLFCIQVS